jgi:hypothetical protein
LSYIIVDLSQFPVLTDELFSRLLDQFGVLFNLNWILPCDELFAISVSHALIALYVRVFDHLVELLGFRKHHGFLAIDNL